MVKGSHVSESKPLRDRRASWGRDEKRVLGDALQRGLMGMVRQALHASCTALTLTATVQLALHASCTTLKLFEMVQQALHALPCRQSAW